PPKRWIRHRKVSHEQWNDETRGARAAPRLRERGGEDRVGPPGSRRRRRGSDVPEGGQGGLDVRAREDLTRGARGGADLARVPRGPRGGARSVRLVEPEGTRIHRIWRPPGPRLGSCSHADCGLAEPN